MLISWSVENLFSHFGKKIPLLCRLLHFACYDIFSQNLENFFGHFVHNYESYVCNGMAIIHESEDLCATIENFNIVFYIRYDFL